MTINSKYLYITGNSQIITNINGVDVPQYPYKYKELPLLLSNVHSMDELEDLAGVIENACYKFLKDNQGFNEQGGLTDVGLTFVKSSGSPDNLFDYGASLFYTDFDKVKATKFKFSNPALYQLMLKPLQLGEDTVLVIPKDHSQLLLINENWSIDNSKTVGTQEVIDVTECIYKELQRKYGTRFDKDNNFKHFFNDLYINHNLDMSKTLGALQDFLAGVLWEFDGGKDTMTIKVMKTAEEIFAENL